jgi:hypothetical protein
MAWMNKDDDRWLVTEMQRAEHADAFRERVVAPGY